MKYLGILGALVVAVVHALPLNVTAPTLNTTLVGNVSYTGNGCSTDTAYFKTDANELATFLSGFEPNLVDNQTTVRIECNSRMTLDVPKGWKVFPSLIRSDFFTAVAEGVDGLIDDEAYFSGADLKPIGTKVRSWL